MKSDANHKRKTAKKAIYKESFDDSEEDESIQDLERKRTLKGKSRKNKAIYIESFDDSEEDESIQDLKRKRTLKGKSRKNKASSDNDDDEDFEMLEKEEAEEEEEESLSMQIDEISLGTDGKAEKTTAKRALKPKKKIENDLNEEISLGLEAKKNGKKPIRVRKTKKDEGIVEEKDKKEKKENREKKTIFKKDKNGDVDYLVDDEEAGFEKGKKNGNKKEKKEKEKKEKVPKDALDMTYDIEKNYFYQELTKDEFSKIQNYFESYFVNGKSFDAKKEAFEVKAFLDNYPNLRKGLGNIEKLKKM